MSCYIVVETQKHSAHPFEHLTGHATRDEVIAEFGKDPETLGGRTHYEDNRPTLHYQRWVKVIDCPNRLIHTEARP